MKLARMKDLVFGDHDFADEALIQKACALVWHARRDLGLTAAEVGKLMAGCNDLFDKNPGDCRDIGRVPGDF